MSLADGLNEANNLIQAGQKEQAVRLLGQLMQEHPSDARVWAMLAMAVDDPAHKMQCLNEVMKLSSDRKMTEWAREQITAMDQPQPVPITLSESQKASRPQLHVGFDPDTQFRRLRETSKTEKKSGFDLLNVLIGVGIFLLIVLGGFVAWRYYSAQAAAQAMPEPTEVAAMETDTPTPTTEPRPTATTRPTSTPLPTTTPRASRTPTITPTATQTLTPTPSEADLIVVQGNDQLKAFEFDEAITLYNSALALDPNLISAYAGRARVYLRQEEWDLADADIAKIEEINPEHIEVLLLQGESAARQGFDLNAVSLFSAAIEANPTHARALILRGDVYVNQGTLDAAEDDFELAIELDPTDAWGYNGMGRVALARGDNEAALDWFLQGIEADPADPRAISNAASVYKAMEDYENALALYQQVTTDIPAYSSGHYGLADLYYDQRQYNDAITEFTAALELGYDAVSVYAARGLSYLRLEQYMKAMPEFTAAIADAPDACQQNNRCIVYNALARYPDAIADCTQSIDAGGPLSAYFNRAIAYDKSNQRQLAIEDYQVVLVNYAEDSPEAIYAQQRIDALTLLACTPNTSCVGHQSAPMYVPPFPLATCELD